MIASALISAAALAAAGASASGADGDAAAAPTPLGPPPQEIAIDYTGSVYFLPVSTIQISAVFPDGTYSAAARFQSAGLLRWFDDTDIQAGVSGYREGAVLRPWRYSHVNRASEKGRTVGIEFPGGVATPAIDPPFGSMGEPPASETERAGAIDPLSAVLSIALSAPQLTSGSCDGRIPVFDGKARYDLRLETEGRDQVRTDGWRGDALICAAYLEPVSGYDPGDKPTEEETARPVHIWLADLDGFHAPVRFRAETDIGRINIRADRVRAEPRG